MMIKLLNKIGLYTAGQMKEIELYVNAVEERVNDYVVKCREFERENERLKLKLARNVKRKRK